MHDSSQATWLSAAALQGVPAVDVIAMDGGQVVPLKSSGSRTTTTMRHARAKGQAYDAGRADRFKVGMDINLLIKELHQNTLRHLCIEDEDRTRLFADPEVRILAAAIADNTSVITLRIPGCHATDVSLIPLYKALSRHPSIRSLDVSDTKGSEASGKALCTLVCKNTQIVHVEYANIRLGPKDSALLEEALRMNCFSCQDPGKNPYDASLIRYVDQAGKTERAIKEHIQLQNPWMMDAETGETQLHVLENIARLYAPAGEVPEEVGADEEDDDLPKKRRKRKKGVTFDGDNVLEVHRQVCDDYMNGQCRYGSRCKYLHPERTSATINRIIAVKAQEEEERLEEEEYRTNNDDRTTVASRATTRSRLRGRTSSSFKFDPKKVGLAQPVMSHVPATKSDVQRGWRTPSLEMCILMGSFFVTLASVAVGFRSLK